MATTNLGLTLPTVGGDEDTWGDELNTALTAIDTFNAGAGASGTIAALFPNYHSGLTLSTAGSSEDFAVAAGAANNSTNAAVIKLASSITKDTGSWAVGTGQGSLDTGTIANGTWYHVYLIRRVDTGVTDIIISLSASAPALPTNYTLYRWIGAILTDGSAQWVKFVQTGALFQWDVPINDINNVTLNTTSTLLSLSVPPGIKVRALIRGFAFNVTPAVTMLITSPNVATPASGVPDANVTVYTSVSNIPVSFDLEVETNTSQQVRAVASASNTPVYLTTYGWVANFGNI